MGKDENIRRYTAEELRAKLARGESRTDHAYLAAMTEEELERAIADDPDSDPAPLDPPQGWSQFALPILPKAPKKLISLRLDIEVIEYFRNLGPGYQTMMNAVLLNYVRAMRKATELAEQDQRNPAPPRPSA